ncbi:Gfo/Idh/MocA family protein [Sandaracinobacteroides saxicola]|uniref:Gfo/Idh/MocA family oxidoreductase n=1 Tax=Sandaracinobacteroides saxicola TaxID=2759707 RepID=A0A7G5IKC7_9SPHN|nr:Gfo/Idh/MocA family oxidoreductase [Sandaracinobacteroides saxicola]QMW23819.1 Gfo/Idh/MocA family oxidoreductase [Sandaracinobacteroides saxicola]
MTLPWALVGGGGGAMIGPMHRAAALGCGAFTLVAAAPSSRAEVAAKTGAEWGLPPAATFADWRDLVAATPVLGLRAVSIATPNALHAEQASAFLRAGVAVICDKPLTGTLAEAEALAAVQAATGTPLFVTYNYSAFPRIREARAMAAAGDLGTVTQVLVEFAQDGRLTERKPRGWRHDPALSGAGGASADVGTHAFHLAEFVSGQRVSALAADIQHVAGGPLDDGVHALLRFDGGARGLLWATQAAPGTRPGLRLRVVGTRASLDWHLAAPDQLPVTGLKVPAPGMMPVSPDELTASFTAAFTALYADIAAALAGRPSLAPDVADGVRGLRFVETVLASNGRWLSMA